MRLRFSLRTLFIAMTLAAACYMWFVLPTLTAKRFLSALAEREYELADQFFLHVGDQLFENRDEKSMMFRSTGELLPLTWGQLLRGQRQLRISVEYIDHNLFDMTASSDMLTLATPLGLKSPTFAPPASGGIIGDTDLRGLRLP